jgi:hypothetical protein
MKELLFFYGLECPHCIRMEKFVDRLVHEGYQIRKVEVWHDEGNNKMLEELDCTDEPCGGVPFFINQKTCETLCGEFTYKQIKKWADGEK